MTPILASTYHTKIRHGIGDDAAVWQPSRSHYSVISTDVSVEGIHFRRNFATAVDVGFRALAINLSDLAAMGAKPVLATIALTLPREIDTPWIVAAYEGMAELARSSGIALVGGDISRGPMLSFGITVVGEVSPQRCVLRSGARIHDVVAVTGPLGRSRAGLALLEDPTLQSRVADAAFVEEALAAYRRPQPRLAYAKFLAASKHVNAMMDLSDGLSIDVARLGRASGCAVEIDLVPCAAPAVSVAKAAAVEAQAWALDGGDDYELLLTVDRRAFTHLARRFQAFFGTPLIAVGRCIAGSDNVLNLDGVRGELPKDGWDHLS